MTCMYNVNSYFLLQIFSPSVYNLHVARLKIVRRKLAQKLSLALKLTDMLGFCLLTNQLRFLSQFTSHDF